MRKLWLSLLSLGLMCQPIQAQVISNSVAGGAQDSTLSTLSSKIDTLNSKIDSLTNSVACGPITKTFTASTDTPLVLACQGAGSYQVSVSTPSGQTGLTGSLQFLDSTSGAGKRVLRGSVAPLDVSLLSYTGTTIAAGTSTTPARVYSFTGGNSLSVALTSYTSGQMTVTITANQAANYPILNGEVQTSALVALLNGRSFTAGFPGGVIANLTNGNYACLTLTNPSTTGMRAIFETRQFSNDVVAGQIPARYFVLNNATTGLPTTSATVNKRGAAGTSMMTATYGSLSSLPSGGSTGLGGYVPTNGQPFSPSLEKTLEPGENTTMCVQGVVASGGLTGTATSSPSVLFGWREQSVN